jgi:peptidoglycan/xylan/chitin deacetylase (PgdA/CDA1 family)
VLRQGLKTSIAAVLHASGADRLIRRLSARRVPVVFGYHRVVDDVRENASHSIDPMLISVRMLEQHLDWIASQFEVVSLDELAKRVEADEPAGRFAAITFDDGYRDTYDHAFPLLRRKGIPAAVFLVTDRVGTSELHLHDRLYLDVVRAFAKWRCRDRELDRILRQIGILLPPVLRARVARTPFVAMRVLLTTLPQAALLRITDALEADIGIDQAARALLHAPTWEMVAEMARHDIVIGSHTRTHILLTNEAPERVRAELVGSRAVLEHRLGRPVDFFSYPDGRFDPDAVGAVMAAGYRLAFTTCHHRDRAAPNFTVPRRLLWERSSVDGAGRFSPAIMACQINGLYDFRERCRRDHRRLRGQA